MNKGLRSVELSELMGVIQERQDEIRAHWPGTSIVEVLNVSPHGFWLMVREREYFLPFDEFPWFRGATLEGLFEVELLHEMHLYWPGLDVDLDLDRIEHPERYPLVAKSPA